MEELSCRGRCERLPSVDDFDLMPLDCPRSSLVLRANIVFPEKKRVLISIIALLVSFDILLAADERSEGRPHMCNLYIIKGNENSLLVSFFSI